jgi:hypothetical protein
LRLRLGGLLRRLLGLLRLFEGLGHLLGRLVQVHLLGLHCGLVRGLLRLLLLQRLGDLLLGVP